MMIFSTIVNIYHAINNFLSTPGGDLAKRTLEFVLLFFMTYMAYSELYREKAGKQIQYMATGFFILTLERLLLIISYASVVFGKINPVSILPISYTLSEAGESLGLIFITASFIYPLFWKNRKNFRGIVKKETLLLIAIFILTQGFVLLGRGVAMPPYLVTSYFYFTLFKLGILVLSIFILWKNNEILGKYNRNVVVAFMIYTVTPMITLINFIFYNNNNQYLYVLAHPFPFISILLLLRVTYLKLADKGTLKHDLEIARQRYDHERAVGKMKDDFVSTVSHELRTPLTSMKLYLSLLKQGQFGKLNKQQIEKIDLVRNETSRLTDLINDILDLSRLEKGKSKIHIKETNFRKLVEKSIMPNLSDEKNIIVKNNIPEDIFVNLDENKMKQVIVNLFSNAVKFTEPGGQILFSAKKDEKGFSFSVKDTGRGIPEEKIPKLFNKFYQVEEHMTREIQGTGLGLAIVKQIVNMHQGTIKVFSEVGKGTRFTIRIPKAAY